jgi:hypothetical protein
MRGACAQSAVPATIVIIHAMIYRRIIPSWDKSGGREAQ